MTVGRHSLVRTDTYTYLNIALQSSIVGGLSLFFLYRPLTLISSYEVGVLISFGVSYVVLVCGLALFFP